MALKQAKPPGTRNRITRHDLLNALQEGYQDIDGIIASIADTALRVRLRAISGRLRTAYIGGKL